MKPVLARLLAVMLILCAALCCASKTLHAFAAEVVNHPMFLPHIAKNPASEPPTAPDTLSASWDGAHIVLAWRDTSNNEESFHLEGALSAGSFVEMAIVGPNRTSTLWMPPAYGEWTFRVRACNRKGCSAPSEATSIHVSPVEQQENASIIVRNQSRYAVIHLVINEIPLIMDAPGLLPGNSLSFEIPYGDYPVDISLGAWPLNMDQPSVYFSWGQPVAAQGSDPIYLDIPTPATNDILSGFGGALYWKDSRLNAQHQNYEFYCFYSDGSLRYFFGGVEQGTGSFTHLSQPADSTIVFTMTVSGQTKKAFYNVEYRNFSMDTSLFESDRDITCPPAPK